jgi:hypothetical protein
MAERTAGFYWVRHGDEDDWVVAQLMPSGDFLVPGYQHEVDPSDFAEIGDRVPQRGARQRDEQHQQAPEVVPIALGRALYAASELGLWPDDVNDVSADQAVMCWRLIERIRASGEFPEGLRM